MKILILGHMRSGKDTLAELFNLNFGMSFKSSSEMANELFIFDQLKNKYNYKSLEQCFDDRINHRDDWYKAICDYNKDNRARLAIDILSVVDCYVGMRDNQEFNESINQKLFDLIIWVDASERLPLEPKTSFNISMSDADVTIDNNGSLEEFIKKSNRIGKALFRNT